MTSASITRSNRQAPLGRAGRAALVAAATLLAGLSLFPADAARAQATLGEMRRQMTRDELETAAKAAETALATAPDDATRRRYQETVNAYRERLENGDFIPGDRILITVISDSVLSDTFTVRSDRRLQLPYLPDISLHGVLDSELEPFLTKELSKYLRRVELSADVLVRLSVLGAVGRQDFITVPVDQALTDVISGLGGFAGPPDLGRAVVRRNGEVFIDSRGLQEAFAKGKTVGDLSMRDGDIVYIPSAPTGGATRWQAIAAVLGMASGIVWALRWVF